MIELYRIASDHECGVFDFMFGEYRVEAFRSLCDSYANDEQVLEVLHLFISSAHYVTRFAKEDLVLSLMLAEVEEANRVIDFCKKVNQDALNRQLEMICKLVAQLRPSIAWAKEEIFLDGFLHDKINYAK